MTANIIIKEKNGIRAFLEGIIVFKITYMSDGKEQTHGMVNTKEEYEKKLSDHDYVSILHVAPLTYKLAYLYGCLNYERGVARNEVFTFWYRLIGRHEWIEWFVVSPYKD